MVTAKNLTNGRLDFTLKNNKTISINAYESVEISEDLITDTMKNAVGICDLLLTESPKVDTAKKKNGGEK